MKFQGKALFILIIIGSLNSVLSAQTGPNTSIDKSIDKATINEQNMNTASSPYRNLSAEEVIDTMYPDPLAEGFMGKKDTALDIDRNRSVADMLQEFEGQAKVINDATVVPENVKDNHSKEDRERIEARAEKLLKEKKLNESADNKGEKRVKGNPLAEEEVLYDESLASESSEIAGEVSEIASDSLVIDSHQDINTAQIKDWPEANEDPEFSNGKASGIAEDDTEIILVDDGSKPLPDEIPDYANMVGVSSGNISDAEPIDVKEKQATTDEPKKLSKRERLRKKMAIPLEPVLLTQGKPKNDDENLKTFSYSGLLIPENQPVTRRKKMIRWTLKLDDGTRIPIKSNLKLLQEVRKEDNLDDYVTITGKMRRSALEDELKYFVPETIVKGKKGLQGEIVDDKKSVNDKDKNSTKKEFSGKLKNGRMFMHKNASDTAEQHDSVPEQDSGTETNISETTESLATDTVMLVEDKAEAEVEENK